MDKANMVTKIKLYDCSEGNDFDKLPLISITVWLLCISIPAIAGPTADPMYLNNVFIPRDVPIKVGETEVAFTLSCPTFSRANPTPIIAMVIAKCTAS